MAGTARRRWWLGRRKRWWRRRRWWRRYERWWNTARSAVTARWRWSVSTRQHL